MKFVSIVGARPNFVKLSPLDKELKKLGHDNITIHTGQHYDDKMSDAFFREFGIAKPKYNLGIGTHNHAVQIGMMMQELDPVLEKEKPDTVIVYGDTNSTLAGAMTAVKRGIPVAHVEAGCRSWDMTMPEEVNRIIVDNISTFLLCPTVFCRANLLDWTGTKVVETTGDVVADAIEEVLLKDESISDDTGPANYVLATLHRPSNVDNEYRLVEILDVLDRSGEQILFPIHPRTKKNLCKALVFKNITFTPPVGYRRMLTLISSAKGVVTDSGGVQKEAYILKTPCITVRDTTEWPETLEHGWNRLVWNPKDITAAIRSITVPSSRVSPEVFQPGASRRIAKLLERGVPDV